MITDPLNVYLTDHRAGATAGTDHVSQAAERHDGELGEFFQQLSDEIHSDYNTLTSVIAQMNVKDSGVKQVLAKAGTSIAEDKFSGETIDDPEFGTFLTLETLSIGVEGKVCMWKALKTVDGDHPELAALDIDALIERGQSQRDRIEGKRLEIASSALSASKVNA
jgi:hypothetical protein